MTRRCAPLLIPFCVVYLRDYRRTTIDSIGVTLIQLESSSRPQTSTSGVVGLQQNATFHGLLGLTSGYRPIVRRRIQLKRQRSRLR